MHFAKFVKKTTDPFANRVIFLANKIVHLEKSRASSRYEPKLAKGIANDLGTLWHDVNQFIKAGNDIGTEVNLHFIRVGDRLEMMEARMTTVK